MTLSLQIIAAGGAVLISGMIGILLLMPSEKTKRQSSAKVSRLKPDEPAVKDWEAVSLKLERVVQALRKEIEEYQRKEKTLERDLTVQKEKYNKLQEKLAQERDWQKKEEDDIEKKAKEILALKNDVRRIEHDLSVTHAQRLKFERDFREAKSEGESITVVRRNLELQVQKLEAETDNQRKQIKELKWENSQLSQKKDAESWVPKEDFQKLEAEIRNKERDIARLKEQIKREVL